MADTKRALKPPPRIPVKLLKTGDEKVDRVVRSLVAATEKARADQHAKGKNVSVTVSGPPAEKTFTHALGYKPSHFVDHGCSGRKLTFTRVSSDSRQATLLFSSGTGTIALWVY